MEWNFERLRMDGKWNGRRSGAGSWKCAGTDLGSKQEKQLSKEEIRRCPSILGGENYNEANRPTSFLFFLGGGFFFPSTFFLIAPKILDPDLMIGKTSLAVSN